MALFLQTVSFQRAELLQRTEADFIRCKQESIYFVKSVLEGNSLKRITHTLPTSGRSQPSLTFSLSHGVTVRNGEVYE